MHWSWLGRRHSRTRHTGVSACKLHDKLKAAAHVPPFDEAALPSREVRLYWWFRHQGARRAARGLTRWDNFSCAGSGLRCVLDSSDAGFDAAHAVVVWVGARPERAGA